LSIGARLTKGVHAQSAGQMLATAGAVGMPDSATSRMVWGFKVGTAKNGHCIWPEALKTAAVHPMLEGGQGIRVSGVTFRSRDMEHLLLPQ